MGKLSPNFAKMQEGREKLSCYGKYGKPSKGLKCGFCWFHTNCKDEKPKRKVKVKKEDVVIEPVAEIPEDAVIDNVELEIED